MLPMLPDQSTQFADLVDEVRRKLDAAESADGWDEARGLLESAEEALDEAIDYADRRDAEDSKDDDGKPGIVGNAWRCSGCGRGTLSKCMQCEEPTCGNCLVTHVCEAEEGITI